MFYLITQIDLSNHIFKGCVLKMFWKQRRQWGSLVGNLDVMILVRFSVLRSCRCPMLGPHQKTYLATSPHQWIITTGPNSFA